MNKHQINFDEHTSITRRLDNIQKIVEFCSDAYFLFVYVQLSPEVSRIIFDGHETVYDDVTNAIAAGRVNGTITGFTDQTEGRGAFHASDEIAIKKLFRSCRTSTNSGVNYPRLERDFFDQWESSTDKRGRMLLITNNFWGGSGVNLKLPVDLMVVSLRYKGF